jgi:hypothetical protein
MLLKSWGAALALSLAFMSGVVQAQVVLPGGVTTPGGQPVGVVPMAIINPNDGATCIVGNTGCPSIGGGTGGTVTVTNAFNLEATQSAVKSDLDLIVGGLGNPLPVAGANGSTVSSASNPFNVQGGAASGTADNDAPLNGGGRAATTLPTAVTDGQKVALMLSKDGKLVNTPYAPEELAVRGTATTTGSSPVTLIAAQGAGVSIKVAAVQCFRTDNATTEVHVTLNDTETTGSGTQVPVVPTTSGAAFVLPVPLIVAANTALTFTPSASITSITCNAQGFQAH